MTNPQIFATTSLKSLRLRDLLTFCYLLLPFLIFGYLSWSDSLTLLYWALLGLTESYWALLGLTVPYFQFAD